MLRDQRLRSTPSIASDDDQQRMRGHNATIDMDLVRHSSRSSFIAYAS